MSSLLNLGASRTRLAIMDQETINFVEFDATISETHVGAAEPTDYPVEGATDMTDHIRRLPETLQITAIVSNAPIMIAASLRATPSVPGTDPARRAEEAYLFLVSIKDQGQLVSVACASRLRDYENMAITQISVSRDKDTANIVSLSLSLREIQIATTETVNAPVPSDTSKKKKKSLGNKAKQPTTPKKSESVLFKLFSAFGGG